MERGLLEGLFNRPAESFTTLDEQQIEMVSPRTIRDLDGMAPNLIVNQNPSNTGDGSFDAILTVGAFYFQHDIGNTSIIRLDLSGSGLSSNESVSKSIATEDASSIAGFPALDINLTDKSITSAGVRYTQEKYEFDSRFLN